VLLLILPLKWALPQTMSGLLLLAGASGLALVGAGLSFVMRVEERAALLSATRRHMPGMLQ
jgi:hypothetical protein